MIFRNSEAARSGRPPPERCHVGLRSGWSFSDTLSGDRSL